VKCLQIVKKLAAGDGTFLYDYIEIYEEKKTGFCEKNIFEDFRYIGISYQIVKKLAAADGTFCTII